MVQHAGEVEKVLNRKEPKIRHLAAAVYAELAGRDAIPRMRQLLQDDDAEIRGIASGTLIRHKDRDSYEDICRAVKGIKDPHLGCQLVALISKANSIALVPMAIEFLQTDGCAGGVGDDNFIPAFKAQAALKSIAGHDFPFDVTASRKAWERARGLEPQKRKQYLASVLPYNSKPLTGRLIRKEKEVVAVVTNNSDKALWLAKVPDWLDMTWTNGKGGGSFPDNEIKGRESFVELAPGKSLHVPLDKDQLQHPELTRLMLWYLHNGNQHGVNAWIGPVNVSFEGLPK
jgi:hypothetical protein